ncbi:MAG: hypothetical protein R3F15_21285 [Lysobacterales bacterium]
MTEQLPWVNEIRGQRFHFMGPVVAWPRFHGADPAGAVAARGGIVVEQLIADLDYAVFGSGRQKGKADAERKAAKLIDKGASFQILDEVGFIHLMRPQLEGCRFHVAGELDFGRGSAATAPPALVQTLGAIYADKVDDTLDYLVIGDRRGKGKAAAIAAGEKLRASGSGLRVIDEAAFMELVRAQAADPSSGGGASNGDGPSPLAELVIALPSLTDTKRIQRALDMLRRERMQLYSTVADDHVAGIVRSQTGYSDFYSTRISADGRYSCCDSGLDWCMGMNGAVCKHLLVLLLGLVQSGQLAPGTARDWLAATRQGKSRRPAGGENMRDLLADTVLRYKAAQAGELDWRPTETVPEDYYAY